MRPIPQPRSLVGLILLGFALASLPLAVAVIGAVIHVERLEERSQALVQQGLLVTRHGESLSGQLVEMERNARQYQVIGDPGLRNVYRQRQEQFLETLNKLESLPVAGSIEERVQRIREHSRAIMEMMDASDPQAESLASALERMDTLGALIADINREGENVIREELNGLQSATASTRRQLALQSALAIPAAVVLALVFTLIINRPVRQLRVAIRRLGRGEFERPIHVDGPQELRTVGNRLDWMRQRLLELEEEKSRFLRHMSHELKTPLASLHEGSELLLDGSTGELSPTQREVAELLRTNTLELQQMIVNLLDFRAWQEKTARINPSDFDLLALARTVAERHRLTSAARNVDIQVAGDSLPVRADRDKLRTALDNLVSNAVKYSPEGGSIRLTVRRGDDTAVIEIWDQGPGVRQADRERIFEPFFQGSTPHAGPVRGTGIGLSVVRECINAHGGDVEILDSTEGAHFRIGLPRR